jgi:hypothetical protein
MRQLTYAVWLKNNVDFSTHSGLINVITAAFNGDSPFSSRFTFTQFPPELADDVRQLAELVDANGLAFNDRSFISMVQFGYVKTFVVNIQLPEYGYDSFTRLVFYGGEPIAQQFDFSGGDFIALTLIVNSPWNTRLTGSNPILRNWDPLNAIPLTFGGGHGGAEWYLTIPVIPGETLEFKFVNPYDQYEPGPNRIYTAGPDDEQLHLGRL